VNEFETDIEVTMPIKVRFSPVKGYPATRHEPGCPDHIDEIEFKIIAKKLVHPLSFDTEKNRYKTEEVEIEPCDHLHDMILGAQDWDAWQEQCLESAREDEEEIHIGRLDEEIGRREDRKLNQQRRQYGR